MTVKELEEMGFIYKHLFGNWYIVRLYTRGWGRWIMFPLRLANKS